MKKFQNTLYINDNLYILLGLDSESVDLIYLDPPFNSKRMYSAPVGSKAAGVSFKDMWTWQDVDEYNLDSLAVHNLELTKFIVSVGRIHGKAMMSYLTYMAQRIVEMHRVLKPTGSLYLHCDPTASHFLKIVLDSVFGKENFRNEIMWKRTSSHNDSKKWAHIHDTIFFYAGKGFTWNPVFLNHDPEYVRKFYRFEDERGHFRLHEIIRTASMGPRPNLAYEYKGYRPEWGWRLVREKVEALDRDGYLQWGKSGRPYLKRYLHKQKGTPCNSLWIDIPPISAHAKEKLGYPTQKPLALLNRIIQASSNEGDIVLDPFCGCATTCVAATQLSRKWIGIDIEKKASDILTHRLSIATGLLDDFIITDIIPSRSDLKVVQPTESVKNLLYKEQRGLCNACGSEFEIRNLEIDHIIPKSKGGGDYYENYQLLCGSCNRIKGDRPMEYLRAKIATIELARGKVFFGE